MAELVCPICAKPVAVSEPLAPAFPFCSARCRTLDLARWADGGYVVPGRPVVDDASASESDDSEGSWPR